MIAKQFLITGMIWAILGGLMSVLFRLQLGYPDTAFPWLEDILGIEENTPARRRMRTGLVREAMTPDPVFVNDEATLDEVVSLMDARHVAQLPVVCGAGVIGIIALNC